MMTNITNIPSENNIDTKIQSQFADFLSSLDNKTAGNFYRSFFTKSEQIMFVKRLAVIMMLEKSVPYAHIATVLNVSTSTVKRIDVSREDGEFDKFLEMFTARGREERFWKIMKALIEDNVHQYGASGWSWLNKIDQ